MLFPIVDRTLTFLTVEKAHGDEVTYERALFPWPIDGELNVLVGHARQRTVATVVGRPQEQAHKMPSTGNTSAPNELLGLRMGGKPGGDTCIAGHRQAPIS
ncbi:hypothetical protein CKY39_19690 [Variovorax boronicumulans]|uniref:Uncharacterized protein n=1 Tax=Variovorax boronicumulans TaxID=436515 RepID=A0A250DLD5_9BURK|nr:hypothetical protein CKY39_19690 [Variovorax boronicumulans]